MIVILMGVTGAGKTTVGRLLADALSAEFVDADDFHPPANVAKMRAGIPLDDADRAPWLARVNALLRSRAGADIVLACSALKERYRTTLTAGLEARVVHLSGSRELLRERLRGRRGHYMNPGLLDSQLETLEAPAGALVVDIAASPETIVAALRRALAT
jgi:gluconokinase